MYKLHTNIFSPFIQYTFTLELANNILCVLCLHDKICWNKFELIVGGCIYMYGSINSIYTLYSTHTQLYLYVH